MTPLIYIAFLAFMNQVSMKSTEHFGVIQRDMVPIGEVNMQNSEKMKERYCETTNVRVKRQSGGGKYSEAAKMPQMKILRLFLQMFKNLWASSYVGGSHPFHHEVPKPVVKAYKEKIVEFFFPDIEDAKVKEGH